MLIATKTMLSVVVSMLKLKMTVLIVRERMLVESLSILSWNTTVLLVPQTMLIETESMLYLNEKMLVSPSRVFAETFASAVALSSMLSLAVTMSKAAVRIRFVPSSMPTLVDWRGRGTRRHRSGAGTRGTSAQYAETRARRF